jgi:protein SCO1
MTMDFALGKEEGATLEPGDRARFVLRVGTERSWIEDVRVIGRASGSDPKPAPSSPLVRLRKGDAIPPLSLVDQDGHPLTEADFMGRLTVLTFVFTRCPVPDYCPLLSRRFSQIQAALASDHGYATDVRLLSVTIDPAFDTPSVLKAYAQAVGADPNRWRFAGGETVEVTRAARAFSVYVERNDALLDHTLATALSTAVGVSSRSGAAMDGRRVKSWRPCVSRSATARAAVSNRRGLLRPPEAFRDPSPRRGRARNARGLRIPSR